MKLQNGAAYTSFPKRLDTRQGSSTTSGVYVGDTVSMSDFFLMVFVVLMRARQNRKLLVRGGQRLLGLALARTRKGLAANPKPQVDRKPYVNRRQSTASIPQPI